MRHLPGRSEGYQEPCTDVRRMAPSRKSRSHEKFLRLRVCASNGFLKWFFEFRTPSRPVCLAPPPSPQRSPPSAHSHTSIDLPTLPAMRVRAVLLLALVLALVALPAARAGSVEEEIDNELMSGTRRSRFFEFPSTWNCLHLALTSHSPSSTSFFRRVPVFPFVLQIPNPSLVPTRLVLTPVSRRAFPTISRAPVRHFLLHSVDSILTISSDMSFDQNPAACL